MTTFASLKKNRKQQLENLKTKLEETATGKNKRSVDERFWTPAVDKIGNGYAVLRFLPPKEGDIPYVRLFSHGFKGPNGQWYIENSRTTIDEIDPVGELNSELWNNGNKEEARKQKRRLHFISNVLIVKDPANPENEGKVFLYKYGKKIFEKLNAAMNPEYEDEEAMNPFDMWEGADFRLKIRKYEGYRNYDKSDFAEPSPVAKKDDAIKEIWDRTYNIDSLVAPDQFKSYDELKTRLNRVLGVSAILRKEETKLKSAESEMKMDESESNDIPEDINTSVDEDVDEETNLDNLLKELNSDE